MMSAVHRIIQQTKKDVNTLKKAYEFSIKKEFDVVDNVSTTSVLGTPSVKYVMWVYQRFNKEEYLEFLSQVVTKKIDLGNAFEELKFMRENINLKSLEIIDRLDYSLDYLNNNFDIRLPQYVMPKVPNGKISITNEYYNIDKLIDSLEHYLTRIEMLQKNIDGFMLPEDQSGMEKYRMAWIEKLTSNKYDDLLAELIQYFTINKEKDILLKIIQLKQRYNKWKGDEQMGTIVKQDLDAELNKISKAILELIV